jgi:signal transduction histidine kinase/ActR/RegA family two-component response regulator
VIPVSPSETRVLVLAPTKADSEVTLRVLGDAGISATICDSAEQMGRELRRGAGALIITDDYSREQPVAELRPLLGSQPPWSEVPVLVLAHPDYPRHDELRSLPGVVLLDRPVNIRTLISAVQAALRARWRQYELRNQLEQTHAANRELQNQARAKDDFLATLSHELRNPLSALTTAAHLLDRDNLDSSSDLMARQIVKRQTSLMGRLLDDLLDVSRITRGKLEIRKTPTVVSAIVESAIETVQPLLNRKGHAFSVSIPDRDVIIEADSVRLAQVLANLLTNAAKYTEPHGRIELSVERAGDMMELRVRDSGIGIPPESKAEVFKMFAQLRPAIDRSEGGLGIGLALAKGLTELHGGTIEVASEGLGRGSEFTVRIPVARPSAQAAGGESQASSRSAPKKCELIVADDNPDALQSLAMLLEMEGHKVRAASDGPSALALAEQKMPDLMLLDIGMPGLNGYEVASRVRELEGGDVVMLVALTGWGQPADRARASEAGFDHHLTKPIDYDQLAELLSHLCNLTPRGKPELRVVNS